MTYRDNALAGSGRFYRVQTTRTLVAPLLCRWSEASLRVLERNLCWNCSCEIHSLVMCTRILLDHVLLDRILLDRIKESQLMLGAYSATSHHQLKVLTHESLLYIDPLVPTTHDCRAIGHDVNLTFHRTARVWQA